MFVFALTPPLVLRLLEHRHTAELHVCLTANHRHLEMELYGLLRAEWRPAPQ